MKHFIPTLVATGLVSSLAWAQPVPLSGPGPNGDRPGDRREGPGGEGGDGPVGREGPLVNPRAMAGARPGPLEHMKNFLDVIDRYNQLGKDADATAVAAVINTIDILRPRGTDAITTRLENMLSETQSIAAQRVIRLQLADFYRQSNQPEKALEQLDVLISGRAGN